MWQSQKWRSQSQIRKRTWSSKVLWETATTTKRCWVQSGDVWLWLSPSMLLYREWVKSLNAIPRTVQNRTLTAATRPLVSSWYAYGVNCLCCLGKPTAHATTTIWLITKLKRLKKVLSIVLSKYIFNNNYVRLYYEVL